MSNLCSAADPRHLLGLTGPMHDFIAYTSRKRAALLVLGSATAVLMGLWMGGIFGPPPVSHRYPSPVVYGIGWFSILFFGACVVGWGKKLFNVGEELRISTVGIRWSRWSDQTIPWSEISNVTQWKYKGSRSIILHLRDPAMFPGKGVLGWTAGLNRALTGGDITVDLVATDRTFDEAVAAIDQFRSVSVDERFRNELAS